MVFSNKLFFTGERASLKNTDGINLARYKFCLSYVRRGTDVLEVGCGFGYGTSFLSKDKRVRKILAYDADREAINFAKTNFVSPKITYKCEKIENIKTRNKFDMVIALEVIEHLSQPKDLLKLAKRALRKRGVLVISTPNRLQSSYDGNMPSNPFHIKEYYPKEFSSILNKFFGKVDLYGIFISSSGAEAEKKVQGTWNWKLASWLVRKRWIRQFVNYLPQSLKKFYTGEKNLDFKPDDFYVSKDKVDEAQYLIATCSL